MNELRAGYEEKLKQQQEAQRESQAQVDRMSETLRTLNGIFRDIQVHCLFLPTPPPAYAHTYTHERGCACSHK